MPFRYQHSGMAWGRGLFALLLLLVIVVGVIWVVSALSRPSGHPRFREHRPEQTKLPPSTEALRILEERFARGEIDPDEFTRRRDLLRNTSNDAVVYNANVP